MNERLADIKARYDQALRHPPRERDQHLKDLAELFSMLEDTQVDRVALKTALDEARGLLGTGRSLMRQLCESLSHISRLNLTPCDDWLMASRDFLARTPAEALETLEKERAGYRIFKDGDMWCAVGPGFIDLQVSPAGFGKTPVAALAALAQGGDDEAR